MNRTMILIVLAVAAIVNPVQAEQEIEGQLNLGWGSRFHGGIPGPVIYKGQVMSSSVKLTLKPIGVYTEVWGQYSPDGGFNSDSGDEVDFTVGIARKVSNVGFDLNYSRFNLYDLNNSTGDLDALKLSMNMPTAFGVDPYLKTIAMMPLDAESPSGGWAYRAGASRGFEISDLGRTINLDVSVSGHDGLNGKRPESLSSTKLSISTRFQILDTEATFTPAVHLQKRLGYKPQNEGMTQDMVWYEVGFNFPL